MCWINQSLGWKICAIGNGFSDARGAVIHLTTNGGVNWQKKVLSTTSGELGLQVQFINANIGWASIFNASFTSAKLMKSTNGGNNWNLINTSIADVGIFYFVDENNGWSVEANPGGNPPFHITHTTNGGINWSVQLTDNTPGDFNAIIFTDSYNGWITGGSGKILKTTNGGTNWSYITNAGLNSNYKSKTLFFLNANTGWISERESGIGTYYVLYTKNGGVNWTWQTTPVSSSVFNIHFFDAFNGGLTADYGQICHTTNGGGVWVKNISSEVPSAFSLSQNFPNPFNPTTNIKFQVKSSNVIKLVVFDILGKEIATLVNEKLAPGTYEITFDASTYPSGVYFYKLETDGFTETKKMLMIK